MKSLYKTLEIGENASADEIKKSYRRLARKYHPDVNPDKSAEEKFKEINAAYEVLSDPKKKAQYDAHGDAMFGGQNFSDFARGGAGGDISEILRNLFGDGNFGGFGGFGGFQDLDIESAIEIPMRLAILGGKQLIRTQMESFEIKIPAGVKNGEMIRAAGKGRMIGKNRGDLLLKISVAPDPDYEQNGDDLTKNFDVPLGIAMFGGAVDVETLYKNVRVKIPQNTKNSQKFRVKELGAKNRKTGKMGDLYLRANVILPNIQDLDASVRENLRSALQK